MGFMGSMSMAWGAGFLGLDVALVMLSCSTTCLKSYSPLGALNVLKIRPSGAIVWALHLKCRMR